MDRLFDKYKATCLDMRTITLRGQYVGFHAYEDAPDQVAFLRQSHRHIFKWRVDIEVKHDNRELEFFMVHQMLEQKVIPYIHMTGNIGSCEQQAEKILEGLVNEYGVDRQYAVSVSEDGENDGSVYWAPAS